MLPVKKLIMLGVVSSLLIGANIAGAYSLSCPSPDKIRAERGADGRYHWSVVDDAAWTGDPAPNNGSGIVAKLSDARCDTSPAKTVKDNWYTKLVIRCNYGTDTPPKTFKGYLTATHAIGADMQCAVGNNGQCNNDPAKCLITWHKPNS